MKKDTKKGRTQIDACGILGVGRDSRQDRVRTNTKGDHGLTILLLHIGSWINQYSPQCSPPFWAKNQSIAWSSSGDWKFLSDKTWIIKQNLLSPYGFKLHWGILGTIMEGDLFFTLRSSASHMCPISVEFFAHKEEGILIVDLNFQ